MKINGLTNAALARGSEYIESFPDRCNSLDDWDRFFKSNFLCLLDFSDSKFSPYLEPIASSERITRTNKWRKKFTDYSNAYRSLGYTSNIEEFKKEYLEVEKSLKNYDLSPFFLYNNNLWNNTRGYEYYKILASGYKNSIIAHACTKIFLIDNKFEFIVHPGRHSHWARRLLGQKDYHFVSINKHLVDRFFKQFNVVPLITIKNINQIIENLPKQIKSPRLFLQNKTDPWPFITYELDLPMNEWGHLDNNNQITISNEYFKKFDHFKEILEKIKNGYNPTDNYYTPENLTQTQLQILFFAFKLTGKENDSIFKIKNV